MTDPKMYMFADIHVSEEATHRKHNDVLRDMFGVVAKHCAPGDAAQFYGDSVDSPTKGNYALLAQVISPLIDAKVPLSFIKGNHDNSKVGLFWWSDGDAMFQAFRKHVNALPRQFQMGNCQMINVDTTLHTWLPTDLAQGEIGRLQLMRLKRDVDEARQKGLFTIVGGHHDPTNMMEPERLLDAPKLFNLLRRCKVNKYICGHSHYYDLFAQRFQNEPGATGQERQNVTEIIVLSDPVTKHVDADGMCFGPGVLNLATGDFNLVDRHTF